MKKIILFAIIIASALSVNSCTTQSEKEENSENSTVVTEIEETKSKPEPYLVNNTVYIETTGAGFKVAEACVRLKSRCDKKVNVGVAAYARGKRVGDSYITIDKGDISGCDNIRLHGFAGWFEEKIPSTVSIKITSIF